MFFGLCERASAMLLLVHVFVPFTVLCVFQLPLIAYVILGSRLAEFSIDFRPLESKWFLLKKS